MTSLVYPLDITQVVETQSFADHEARARELGLCSKPGPNCRGYYYGGIDWASLRGPLRIFAAAGGVVTHVGYNDRNTRTTGYGYYVRTKHGNGIEITYAHLEEGSALVYPKQNITVSQVIGKMGSTGNSTGLHLHFQLTENGVPIDPAPLLSGWGVQPPPVPPPDVMPPPAVNPAGGTLKLPIVLIWSLVDDYQEEYRNIRQEPNTQSLIVGKLFPNQNFEGDLQAPGEGGIWIQHPSGGWVSVIYGGTTYLQAVTQ